MSGQSQPPVFTRDFYKIALPIFGEPNQSDVIQCSDPNGTTVTYSLLPTLQGLSIDENTGRLIRTSNVSTVGAFFYNINCSNGINMSTANLAVTFFRPNLNAPIFSMATYSFSINENNPDVTEVGTVQAIDPDGDTVGYSLEGFERSYFRIFSGGQIFSAIRFDREMQESYSLNVLAYDLIDRSQDRRTSAATVTVTINDVNDNRPEFVGPFPVVVINQNLVQGSAVTTVSCTDVDVGPLSYRLSSTGEGRFTIDMITGNITFVSGSLLQGASFLIVVECSDGIQEDTQFLNITVEEENQNNPILSHATTLRVNIEETVPLQYVVADINATDADVGEPGRIIYRLMDDYGKFAIDESTGVIRIISTLDYETQTSYLIVISVENPQLPGSSLMRSTTAFVEVNVENVNDHPPEFVTNYLVSVNETYLNVETETFNIPPPVNFVTVSCTDSDIGETRITYSLGVMQSSPFAIDPILGNISAIRELDFEATTSYSLPVYCYDNGMSHNLTGSTLVEIAILPVNEHRPDFTSTDIFVSVNETAPIGTIILSFDPNNPGLLNYTARDADSGPDGEIFYFLGDATESGIFEVDRDQGIYRVRRSLDADNPTTRVVLTSLQIVPCDGLAIRDDCKMVTIRVVVTAVNEHMPVFSEDMYTYLIPESTTPSNTFNVTCTDDDEKQFHGVTTISIRSGRSNEFTVDSNGLFFLLQPLDYETNVNYGYELECTDGTFTTSTIVNITVLPVNDNIPRLVGEPFIFNVSVSTPVLSRIGRVTAVDDDQDDGGQLRFTLNSRTYFTIDSNTGYISLLTRLDRPDMDIVPPPNFTLQANVTDGLTLLTTSVTIYLTDGNYISPRFVQPTFINNVLELQAIGYAIQTLTCTDSETGVNGEITYGILEGNSEGLFDIGSKSGILTVAGNLVLPEDERTVDHTLRIQCSDGGVPIKSDTTLLIVRVMPNDSPVNATDVIAFVLENADINHVVATINATDLDNNRLMYAITDNGNNNMRFVVSETGQIIVNNLLDREITSEYRFVVEVSDGSSTTSVNVSIFVRDVNDNDPRCSFLSQILRVEEQTPINTILITLGCSDIDSADNSRLNYTLADSTFKISPNGELILANSLNAALQSTYTLGINISDNGINVRRSIHVTIIVLVLVNNTRPPQFQNFPPSIEVNETTPQLEIIYTVEAIDPEGNPVSYRLADENTDTFLIIPNSGDIILLRSLDFYDTSIYVLTVIASDGELENVVDLTINVTDVNEFFPSCSQQLYFIDINENTPVGSIQNSMLSCTDDDRGANGNVVYSTVSSVFRISNQGSLEVLSDLDYEIQQQYTLTITVSDGGNPPRTTSTMLVISINPLNEFPPSFNQSEYQVNILESLNIGSDVLQVFATDMDLSTHRDGQISYSISSDGEIPFSINNNGVIRLFSTIDSESDQNSTFSFVVFATDGGDPARSGSATVVITIEDVNDNRPSFARGLYTASVPASLTTGAVVLPSLNCTDQDSGVNAQVSYYLENSDFTQFMVDGSSGIITVQDPLPPSGQVFSFNVICADMGSPAMSSTVQVSILVISDGDVTFSPQMYMIEIPEDATLTGIIANVSASSPAGAVTYSLLNHMSTFNIDSITGAITLTSSLDYEMDQVYVINVQATVSGAPSQFADAIVEVRVININDEAPLFSQRMFSVEIPEGSTTFSSPVVLNCTDDDLGVFGQVEYSISNDNFARATNGNLQVLNPLDSEAINADVLIFATCSDGGMPPKNDSITIIITVLPVNEYPPEFSNTMDSIIIEENIGIARAVYTANATDRDFPPHPIRYSIVGGNEENFFSIDSERGIVTVLSQLDYEQISPNNVIVLTIQANDDDPSTTASSNSLLMLTITVEDVNDNEPSFTQSVYITDLEFPISRDTPLVSVICTDADSGSNAAVTYSITPEHQLFQISEQGTIISTEDINSLSPVTYSLMVQCSDQGTPILRGSSRVLISGTIIGVGPIFNQTTYRFNLPENSNIGYEVGRVFAINFDPQSQEPIHYSKDGNGTSFIVHENTGIITLVTRLDYEQEGTEREFTITVYATDSVGLNNSVAVIIILQNVNEMLPSIEASNYAVAVSENTIVGTTLSSLTCRDSDDNADGLTPTLIPLTNLTNTPIGPTSGGSQSQVSLVTRINLDYEDRTQFLVIFRCTDSGGLSSMAEIRIAIEPYNDNPPRFGQSQYDASLVENPRIGTTVTTITASDADLGSYNQIQYSIISDSMGSPFSIDSSTGAIRVTGLIDYELETNYNIVIQAVDVIPLGDTSGSQPLSATVQLDIEIIDLNDNRPSLAPFIVFVNRRESEVVLPVMIETFQCSDIDSGANGEVAIQVTSGNSNFFLSGNSLFFNGSANVNTTFTASVTCSDMGNPQQSRTTPVHFTIIPENLHAPMFVGGDEINITIPDDQPLSESFGRILARDADGSDTADGQISYSIMPTGSIIFIDAVNGDLYVASSISVPAQTTFIFTVLISDSGSPPLTNTGTLYLTVTTGDNSAPQFTRAQYSTSIPETFQYDETFYTEISCTDADRFDSVTYSILSGGSYELFSIHPTSGDLSIATNQVLDFEVTDTHSLLVACSDTRNATTSVNVTITVNPINEFSPRLGSIETTVPETAYVGFLVATFSATDDDEGVDGEIRYTLDQNDAFIIDPISGRVILSSSLDYETGVRNYNLSVVANDLSETSRRMATAQLLIGIEDINDNAPSFTNDIYEMPITATLPVGTVVLSVSCTDNDVGQNGRITYHIISNSSSTDIFDIDANTGNITVAENLEERQIDNATFFVTCRDNIHPVLSDTAIVAIHVMDVNQHIPIFNPMSYNIDVLETQELLETILVVSATDEDIGPFGRITYTIQPPSNIFFINSTTGTLSLLRQLDFESSRSHTLTVVAMDGTPDSVNRMSAFANVVITVINVNEYTPRCPMPIYVGIIANMFTGTIIDFNCVDRDDDSAGLLSYNITEGNTDGLFSIVNSTLNLPMAISTTNAEDRYSLTVTVSDMGATPRQTIISVEVLYSFENTVAPLFSNASYSFTVLENVNIGAMIGMVSATDSDRGIQGEVMYSLIGPDNAQFRIDPNNGIIYLASTLNREESESLIFSVVASDQDPDNPLNTSAPVSIMVDDINDNPPICSQDFYQFQILSNSSDNFPVGSIICSDADSGNNAVLDYAITQPSNIFVITNNGQITLQNRNTLNPSSSALVEVSVSDRGDPSLSILVSISILVVFGNSESPVFTGPLPYMVTVNEDAQLLSTVFQLTATDGDSSISDLRYGFIDNSDSFFVNPNTGEIVLVRSVDYETRQSYTITVEVRDSGSYDGSNVLSSSTTVQINIVNVNDNSPMFDSGAYGTIIPQSESVNSRIINGSCVDNDDGRFGDVTVTWDGNLSPFTLMSIGNGNFTITVGRQLTTSASYSFNITCVDGGNTNSTAMIYISVRAPPDPQFEQTRYEWLVREDANIAVTFAEISATSPNDNNPIVYSFVENSDQFDINPSNGIVSLTQTLDYESQTQFGLIVRVTDTLNQFTDVLLLVRVLDVNDQLPLIPPSAELSVNHNHPVNAPFGFLECSDDDGSDQNSRFNFTFDPPSDTFTVNDVGVVYLIRMLDLTPVYALPVVCFNVETPEVRSFGVVTINVIFNNLYQPLFELQNYYAHIYEKATIEDRVIQVSATDGDVGLFGEVHYSIIKGDDNNHFFINSSSGEIKILLNLDREQNTMFNLTIVAIDGGLTTPQSQRRTGITLVQIFVLDFNDNAPMFDSSLYRFNITTTTPRNSLIGNLACSDPDEGRNMEILYSLRPENLYYFSVNGSGAIFLLDEHSSPAPYTLTAVCSDNGTPQLSSTAILSIIVRLEDPVAPMFNQNTINVTVNENITLFSLITSLSATSNDSTLEIRYNIVSGNNNNVFQIDEILGEIYNVQLLDAELVDEYSIIVEARYTEYFTAVSYATVSVRVTDINDNAPYFVPSPLYNTMILEADGIQEVLTVNCMDNDTITSISYSIVAGNVDQIFSINSAGVIFPTNPFDYEQTSSHTLTINCDDGGLVPRSATAQVIVVVIPQNDHAPEFSVDRYNFVVTENAELGTSVGSVLASDGDSGPHGHITYRIVTAPPQDVFFIHPISGMVQLSGTLDYETTDVYQMYAIASDGYTESTVPLVVAIQDVNDNDPTISPLVSIIEIEHNTSANTVVGHFDCSDVDSVHPQESLTMNITNGNERGWFLLETDGDIIWNGIEININSAIVSTIVIHCYDGGNRRSQPAHFTSVVYPAGQKIPQFVPSNLYITSVDENSPIDTVVITVMTDSSSPVQYSIADLANDDLPFVINSGTGEIRISSDIDYASQQTYNFVVIVNDTTNTLSNAAAVRIAINDINDNLPEFSMETYLIPLPENLLVPAYIATFICTDEDINDKVEISIVAGGGSLFSVSSNGILSVISSLDFETTRSHELLLRCSDGTGADSSTVSITVMPINEYLPIFTNLPYMATVVESNVTQRNIFTVSGTDADQVNGADITYRLITNTATANFQINPISGVIQNQIPLLVVDQTHYALEVIAVDGGLPNVFTATALVVVEVTDINEPPRLVLDATRVIASTASDSVLLDFQCIDNDLNQNAELQLSYQSNLNPGVSLRTLFSYTGTATGQLYVNSTLQYGNYTVMLFCTDMGVSPMSTSENIYIEVINANSEGPEFLNTSYVVSIYENVTINTLLITVLATDPNGVSYQIVSGNEEENFYIVPNNGSIFIQRAVDADFGVTSYNLTVVASDLAPAQPLSATTIVNILVIGINDHDPEIDPSISAVLTFTEDTPLDTQIKQYSCIDIDGSSTRLTISPNGNSNSTFDIAEGNLVVLRKRLDYEFVPSFALTILCTDEATAIFPSRTASTMLVIDVEAVNIFSPVFTNASYNFSIAERSPPGTFVGVVLATDDDNRAMSAIRYSIANSTAFFIGSLSGEIRTTSNLNVNIFEYNITVVASDEDPIVPARSSSIPVTITIFDVNDNRPVCPRPVIEVSLNQTTFSSNTSIVNITCSDEDSGINSLLIYTFNFVSSDKFRIQTVNDMIGEILLSGNINPGIYILRVNVSDRGPVPLSEVVHVIINVQRAPDNRLRFSDPFFAVNVSENTQLSSVIFRGFNFANNLLNVDGELSYSTIVDNTSMFLINGGNGDVSIHQPLDYESTVDIYTIIIDVEDDSGTHALASLSVHVTNFNDERPVFSEPEYRATVAENGNAGTEVIQIIATDVDFSPVMYCLSTSTNDFTINSTTGILTTLRPLDRERGSFTRLLQVNATDSGNPQLFSLVNVLITIIDLNDNPPAFNQTDYIINITNVSPAGRLITLSAYDPDSSSELTYSIDDSSGLFSIDPISGSLQLQATVPPNHQEFYSFTAFVSDGSNTRNASVLVQVFDVTLVPLNFEETDIIGRVEFNITAYLITFGSGIIPDESTYEIITGNINMAFNISQGNITNGKPLDRESNDRYEIILAVNGTMSNEQINVFLRIDIHDINDNAPVFSESVYRFSIKESHYVSPFEIGQIQATDQDAGINSRISFEIVNSEAMGLPFLLQSTTGGNVRFTAIGGIDHEAQSLYNLTILARDFAPINTMTSNAIVLVTVIDDNDNAPIFDESYENPITVVLDTPAGTRLSTLTATDMDAGRNGEIIFMMMATNDGTDVTSDYHLEDITNRNGVVNLITDRTIGLDSDNTIFNITAKDNGIERQQYGDTITLILRVRNSDPEFTSPVYTGQVLENSDGKDNEGKDNEIVLQVVATDKDFGNSGLIRYTFIEGTDNDLFTIDEIRGTINIQPDRKITDTPSTRYELFAEAIDSAPQPGSDTAFVIIDVFGSINVLNIQTCLTYEDLLNSSNREWFRQTVETLIKQEAGGSLFINSISVSQDEKNL